MFTFDETFPDPIHWHLDDGSVVQVQQTLTHITPGTTTVEAVRTWVTTLLSLDDAEQFYIADHPYIPDIGPHRVLEDTITDVCAWLDAQGVIITGF